MTEQFSATFADRLEIQDLTAQFGLACTQHDTVRFRRLWAEDGVWEIGEPHSVPRAKTTS